MIRTAARNDVRCSSWCAVLVDRGVHRQPPPPSAASCQLHGSRSVAGAAICVDYLYDVCTVSAVSAPECRALFVAPTLLSAPAAAQAVRHVQERSSGHGDGRTEETTPAQWRTRSCPARARISLSFLPCFFLSERLSPSFLFRFVSHPPPPPHVTWAALRTRTLARTSAYIRHAPTSVSGAVCGAFRAAVRRSMEACPRARRPEPGSHAVLLHPGSRTSVRRACRPPFRAEPQPPPSFPGAFEVGGHVQTPPPRTCASSAGLPPHDLPPIARVAWRTREHGREHEHDRRAPPPVPPARAGWLSLLHAPARLVSESVDTTARVRATEPAFDRGTPTAHISRALRQTQIQLTWPGRSLARRRRLTRRSDAATAAAAAAAAGGSGYARRPGDREGGRRGTRWSGPSRAGRPGDGPADGPTGSPVCRGPAPPSSRGPLSQRGGRSVRSQQRRNAHSTPMRRTAGP